jgi:hypothetical protein
MECPHCHQALPSLLCPAVSQDPRRQSVLLSVWKPVQKEKRGRRGGFFPACLVQRGNCIGIINGRESVISVASPMVTQVKTSMGIEAAC